MKIIPYGRQSIDDNDIHAVTEVLRSDYLTQGPAIPAFEKAFAEYIGARYAVAVSNGTAALHLAAMANNLQPGDKVLTTPITFAASANCARYCGAEVVFADIDPVTYTIDLDKVQEAFEKYPGIKGVVPVDFAGYATDLEKLKAIADRYGAWILEDACHAPGGYFTDSRGNKQLCGNGQFAGQAIFSFHPVKHIATGEGGMITTNDKSVYERLLILRTHGITRDPELMDKNDGGWYMEMRELGYNYRMPDILAALGVTQLKKAEAGLLRRFEIAERYTSGLAGLPLTLPQYTPGHAFHLYVVQTEKRKELYDYLRTQGIYAQVHYIPVHLMPYYRSFGWKEGDFPVAEAYYRQCLSLPMYPTLTDEEQQYVIEKIKSFYA
ncbi:MAG: UDP-4-amino-4,6-dideoxy-N-acetyl-beta-L-altrosamine transaminase [Chitinophagaceae bacterium]|nr:MAG: UDP-4-amino-4,6-dideoxy-N-acetyl-beta-L-altrosamine transaminase [Chitinophagaceae bacterium]